MKVVAVINIMWAVAATLALIFQCIPVQKAWLPLKEGKCFDYALFTVLVETLNSLIDFVIMALPIGVLQKLRIRRRYKLFLAGIFVLGGL